MIPYFDVLTGLEGEGPGVVPLEGLVTELSMPDLDMCTRLVEIHVYMDLEVIFGVSPGPRSRKNWFHWTSVDPNLEWIDF